MSQENVEVVRRLNAAFNSGDVDRSLEFFDPAAVWHTRADEPDAGDYRGREGIRGMASMWVETFEDFRVELDEYVDAGDEHVVTPGALAGRGRGSGVEVREPYAWVIRLRGGVVVEVWEYSDRAEALEAVGLGG
jgi:ketosteroid isomerase-like protein